MKLIKPSVEVIEQDIPVRKLDDSISSYQNRLLEAVYKQIEIAGRTCYKSNDKITDESAKPFVDRMIASQHYAMLEHGTIYLMWGLEDPEHYELYNRYSRNKYSKVFCTYPDGVGEYCATTNLRVIVENHWEKDLNFIWNPILMHERRITARFICDMGVAREFCRHRVFSFAQESTRYCNYTKDKFDNEITYIEPCWATEMTIQKEAFIESLQKAETCYFNLINEGWKPEQARNVLPLATKTELIMTGFESDWKHFFDLRADGITGKPHPQAEELAKTLKKQFGELECLS